MNAKYQCREIHQFITNDGKIGHSYRFENPGNIGFLIFADYGEKKYEINEWYNLNLQIEKV